jgi:hypothetical protein
MPSAYLAQVALPSTTNLPADDVVNTFVFAKTGPAPSAEDIETVFTTFYNGTQASGDTLAEYLSQSISRTRPAVVKMFDLEDPEPRAPIETVEFTIGLSTTPSKLPDEVALCLSYKGDVASGVPAARRRGRIFLGPFSINAVESGVGTSPAAPTAQLVETVLDAGEQLWTMLSGIWYVWSRADDEIYPITELWVDNAWDSQRRRGRRATSREVRPLSL